MNTKKTLAVLTEKVETVRNDLLDKLPEKEKEKALKETEKLHKTAEKIHNQGR